MNIKIIGQYTFYHQYIAVFLSVFKLMTQIFFLLLLGFCSCACFSNCETNACSETYCSKCFANFLLAEKTCLPCSSSTCATCDGSNKCASCGTGLASAPSGTNPLDYEYGCTRCIEAGKVFSSGKCYTLAEAGCESALTGSGDIYRRCKATNANSCKTPFIYYNDMCIGSVVSNCAIPNKSTDLCNECASG